MLREFGGKLCDGELLVGSNYSGVESDFIVSMNIGLPRQDGRTPGGCRGDLQGAAPHPPRNM